MTDIAGDQPVGMKNPVAAVDGKSLMPTGRQQPRSPMSTGRDRQHPAVSFAAMMKQVNAHEPAMAGGLHSRRENSASTHEQDQSVGELPRTTILIVRNTMNQPSADLTRSNESDDQELEAVTVHFPALSPDTERKPAHRHPDGPPWAGGEAGALPCQPILAPEAITSTMMVAGDAAKVQTSAEQIVQRLSEATGGARGDPTEAAFPNHEKILSFCLQPEHLGDVHIRLVRSGPRMNIEIVGSDATARLLQQDRAVLERELNFVLSGDGVSALDLSIQERTAAQPFDEEKTRQSSDAETGQWTGQGDGHQRNNGDRRPEGTKCEEAARDRRTLVDHHSGARYI